MDGHKRKRDDDGTVVTFYAPDRTFARVYKGQSLEETKDLVRKKLGLSEDTFIRLARLHEGKVIELDDGEFLMCFGRTVPHPVLPLDEDFEAFRHLTRHVPTLDVSVFVGQNGPPIFTRQTTSLESPANPVWLILHYYWHGGINILQSTSKKRNKNRRAIAPISTVSHEPTTRDVTSSKEQISNTPDAGSTLDADGVPKKKRKRKGVSPPGDLAVSPLVHPPAAPHSAPEGHEPSESSRKSDGKSPPQATLLAFPPLPVSHDTVLSPAGAPGPSKSSKRKRQSTPESPSAVPGQSRPSSPSSPVKKKHRKEKRSEDVASTTSVKKQPIARPDKKGKRKADDAMSAASEVIPAPAADAEDAVAAREAAKEAKREAKEKQRQAAETREEVVQSKEDGKRAMKRRQRDTEEAQGTDGTSVPPISSQVELALKKDKRKKRVEAATEPQTAPVDVPIPVAPTDDTPAKSGKERKSRAESRQSGQLSVAPVEDVDKSEPAAGPLAAAEVEADGEPQGKKSRRRKTLSAAPPIDAEGAAPLADNTSEAPSTEGAAVPGAQDGSNSASAKKSKLDRKKSLPASASSSETAKTTSAIAMSAVQAAVHAILARGSSTSAGPVPVPPSQQPAPVTAEPTLPTQKRKAGKSKLSQAWGPDDLVEEQGQASVSAVAPAPTSSAPVSPAAPAPRTKQVKGKKALRPSSAPTCPICDKASLHPRSQCPIVEGGPAAIRKRIAEVKKSGRSEELIEELEVLLKEAQRRRKSAGAKRAAEVTAPVSAPALDVQVRANLPSPDVPVRATPSSPDVPLQSISTSSQSRPPLGDRSLSSPRLPAGSEISEVPVQSRDEGSSNESSSDDDEDEAAPASSCLPLSSSLRLPEPDNLEALLYGPVKPRTSILAQIPSSSESSSSSGGEESDDEAEKDEDVDMDEDEKNDRAFRRTSRKFAHAASSSDEEEPQPDPDQVQELDAVGADVNEPLVPPPEMGTDPNASMDTQDAQQVEADVLAQDISAIERSVEQFGGETPVVPENDGDSSEAEELAEDKASEQSEAESDEEMEPKPVAQPDDPDASPADRGDDHRVEPGAEVDPLASQEHPEVSIEVSAEPEGPKRGVDVDESEHHSDGGDRAEGSVEVSMPPKEPGPELQVDTQVRASSNDDDPELGASPAEASADLSGTTAQAELEKLAAAPFEGQGEGEAVAEGNQDTMQVEVFEPHTEDPDDPIDTFSSNHDQEQRDVLEEDPIEDPDMTQERERTPSPATPRTPGTVRRMKDRHGRPSQAHNHQATARLSQQFLGDLVLSQEEITLANPHTGGALELSLELETAPNVQIEAEGEAGVDREAEVVEPAKTREATASSQSQSQPERAEEADEARPRRTTRTTVRRTSSMAPSSSLPEPQATPTPAPAQRRRGGRLTAEEKAQREAEKTQKDAEKKAERERKATEKAAKEAERKAERERKAAEKRAEKEAKQAEKQAKQKEKAPAKRGKAARGRGGSTKPTSTRSQRALESVELEEEARVDERKPSRENGERISTNINLKETPGVAKVSWAVLPQSESRTQEGSVGETSMIDELHPSSPEASPRHHALVESPALEDPFTQELAEEQENLPTVTPRLKGNKKDPLFFPSSSQHPLTPFGLPNAESTPFADADADDGDSDPGAEAERTFKAPARPRGSWVSQSLYPSLTDLASQSLFSATQIPSPALFSQTPTGYNLSPATYGKAKDDDDDDDDDESSDNSDSSDSDSGKKKSHIPQDRRAGVQKKKKSGLLSAYS
ncbi:hypothetical protein LXA43DRAFT_1079598 [Ganoderma leucocontextum]|nr:hypothetical protein LXA43DRAFT_1079598 [Ganoderma leucocontextum]